MSARLSRPHVTQLRCTQCGKAHEHRREYEHDADVATSLANARCATCGGTLEIVDETPVRLVTRIVDDGEPWFACFSGDCPHQTQDECDKAIRAYVATLEREIAGKPTVTVGGDPTIDRILGPFAISLAKSGNLVVVPLVDNVYDVTIGDRHRRARDVMVHAARGVRFTRDGGSTIEGSSSESH